jgi:uncharacterized protein (DUF983 family)
MREFNPFPIFDTMAHELEKLVCPQCGGNDLLPFGNSAYKCQACGTVLKDNHYSAPVSTDFRDAVEPREPVLMNSEERYPTESEIEAESMDGDTFLKLIVIIGVLILAVFIVWYLLK